MQPVEIACCFDRAYALPTAVVATSILAHASPDRRYIFHAIYDGANDFPARVFEGFRGTRLEVRPLKVRNLFTDVTRAYPGMPPVGFIRLTLPDILPGVAKVISVDPDILCLTDVAPLFDTALVDCPLGAIVDLPMAAGLAWEAQAGDAGRQDSKHRYFENRLGLADDAARAAYFNAGVLLFDLGRLRREGFTAEAKAFIRQPGEILRWNEQCVLSALLARRALKLDARWNAMMHPPLLESYTAAGVGVMRQVAQAWSNPAIVHFNWQTKPWSRDRIATPWASLWWAYCLAAPLPWTMKLGRPFSKRELVKHIRYGAVRAKAAEIRASLARLPAAPGGVS